MHGLTLFRLSLVRFAASFMVVLTTGVINRVFIADLGYSEAWFTLLLCLQQLVTPLTLVTGYWSDSIPIWGRHRAPHAAFWAIAAAVALAAMMICLRGAATRPAWSVALFMLAAVAMSVFGLGVKASNLLITALLVDRLPARRRAGALTYVWFMAIAGLVLGGLSYGILFGRAPTIGLSYLTEVTVATCVGVVALTLVGLVGVEPADHRAVAVATPGGFWRSLRALCRNSQARWFFGFMALAEFSFFCQDLILEVYGGRVFQLSVSATTEYSFYHGLGTLLGMMLGWTLHEAIWIRSRTWQLPLACVLGALAFAFLVGSALLQASALATSAILLLGVAKGGYNTALAGALMDLMDRRLAGVLLGVWGTTAGIAIAAGMAGGGLLRFGFFEAALAAQFTPATALRVSFAGVFAVELLGLLIAALMLLRFRPGVYREELDREIDALMSEGVLART
jgi:BCD family chlorophyll transporter-like MFS transporter